MSNHAATIVEQVIGARTRRRLFIHAIIPVIALVLIDVVVALLAFILAYEIHHQWNPLFEWRRRSILPVGIWDSFEPYISLLLFVPLVKVYTLRRNGFYRLRGEFSFAGDLAGIVKATFAATLILVLFAFLFRQGITYQNGQLIYLSDFSYSRMVMVYDFLFSTGMFWLIRSGVRLIQIAFRSNANNLIPTVVVGNGDMAEICVAEISAKPRLGYKLVGVVTARAREDAATLKNYGVRKLGHFDKLPEIVKKYGVEEVLITDTQIHPRKMFEVLMECGRDHQIKYRVVPNLFDCLPGKTEIATIGTLPMIKLYEEPLSGAWGVLKRSMDIVVALGLLMVSWPLWMVLAILIKRESPGPVFHKQERVGMGGKLFLMFKFRSMVHNAGDEAHREVMTQMITGAEANQGTDENPLYGKVKDDPRLTRIGSWMRRFSIDELPQVLNVLTGQMSIVGPRPPLPYEVRQYKDWHRARFHVLPGITGLWQVSGRNRLHFEEMVRLDIFYIENWSPWLDIKIMLKTLPVMLKGDSLY